MSSTDFLLQTNVNDSPVAQDLLMQSTAEWEVDIAVIAEPYIIIGYQTT